MSVRSAGTYTILRKAILKAELSREQLLRIFPVTGYAPFAEPEKMHLKIKSDLKKGIKSVKIFHYGQEKSV